MVGRASGAQCGGGPFRFRDERPPLPRHVTELRDNRTGAAQISRRAVGTPVFWGMIAANSICIFPIPMLCVTFQTMREWTRRKFAGEKA